MADNIVAVEIVLEDGKVIKGFQKIEKAAGKAGKDAGDSFTDKLNDSIGSIGAIIAGAFTLNKAIEAATGYEKALNQLSLSLSQTGQATKQNISSFESFASSIQDTTIFTDDLALSTAALIQNIGRLGTKDLQQATSAALDLASTGLVSAEQAAVALGKAAQGNVSALNKLGFGIQKTKDNAVTFSNAISAIEKRFQGFGEQLNRTFEGARGNANKSFGDILKNLGFLITKSPIVVGSLSFISSEFKKITVELEKFGKSGNFETFLTEVVSTAVAINQLFVAPTIVAFNIFKTAVLGAVTFASGVISVFQGNLASLASKIVNFFSPGSDIAKALLSFKVITDEVFSDFAAATSASIENTFGDNTAQKIDDFLAKYQSFVSNFKIASLDLNNAIAPDGKNPLGLETITDNTESFADNMSGFLDKVGEELKGFALDSKVTAASVARDLVGGIGNAAARGFATFGEALAKGENGLKAFTKAFIQSIGQTAVQLGTRFILEGVALAFVPGMQGFSAPLIAAGGALAAFGGALSAIGGGSSTGTGVTGNPQVETVSSGFVASDQFQQQEREEPQPTIVFNNYGDVLGDEASGQRIVDLINTAAESSGVKFRGASFA